MGYKKIHLFHKLTKINYAAVPCTKPHEDTNIIEILPKPNKLLFNHLTISIFNGDGLTGKMPNELLSLSQDDAEMRLLAELSTQLKLPLLKL